MEKKVAIVGYGGPRINLAELLSRDDIVVQIESAGIEKYLKEAPKPKLDKLAMPEPVPFKSGPRKRHYK